MTARSVPLAVALIGVACLISASSCSQKEPSPEQGTGARPAERLRGAADPSDTTAEDWAQFSQPLTSETIGQLVAGTRRPREISRGGPQQDLAALANLGPAQPDPNRQWTVIAYLNADCNLESGVLSDFNEMEAGLPERGVEVIALLDRAKGFDKSDGDWTDARVFRLRPDQDRKKINSPILAKPGELDLGNPQTLATIVAAAMRTFPAKHYALLISAHGCGWWGLIGDDDPAGDPNGGLMTIQQMRGAVAGAMQSAGVQKMDLISLDQCLMAQFEVAAELQGIADVLVASEAVVPGHGQPYEKVMPLFTSASAKDIGAGMVKVFGELCDKQGDRRSTMSAIDLARMSDLARSFNGLLAKYKPAVADQWPNLTRSMFYAESYADRTDYRSGKHAFASIDLLDSLNRMRKHVQGPSVAAEHTQFQAYLKQSLLATYAGKGRRLSNGMAIYAPFRADMLNPNYAQLQFASACDWLNFVTGLHQVQKAKLTRPDVTAVRLLDRAGNKSAEMRIAGGQSFEITVQGDNILWTVVEITQRIQNPPGYAVYARSFVPDPGFSERRKNAAEEAAELIDVMMPQYADGKNVLKWPAAGIHYRLTNGQQVCGATLDYSDPSDVRHCVIPIIYTHPSVGQVSAKLSVDTNWLKVDGITGYAPTSSGAMVSFDIEPSPDAQITPYYYVETDDGGRTFLPAGTLTYNRGLRLLPFFYDAGNYALIAEAESIGGSSARKVFSFPVQSSQKLAQWTAVAGKFKAQDLAGTWDWEIAVYNAQKKDYDYQRSGLTWKFDYDPKYPDALDFELKGKDTTTTGFTLLNTQYLPHINVFTKVDPTKTSTAIESFLNPQDEGFARTDFFIAFLLKDGKQAQLILWDPTREIMSRAMRTGQPPPATRPSANLAGTWANAAGTLVQVMTQNSYQTYRNGKLVDKGMYLINEDSIVTTSADGRSDTEKFTMPDADTLVIISATGKQTTFKRRAPT